MKGANIYLTFDLLKRFNIDALARGATDKTSKKKVLILAGVESTDGTTHCAIKSII